MLFAASVRPTEAHRLLDRPALAVHERTRMVIGATKDLLTVFGGTEFRIRVGERSNGNERVAVFGDIRTATTCAAVYAGRIKSDEVVYEQEVGRARRAWTK